VADLLHEVAGDPVLFRNPHPRQLGDGGAHEQHGPAGSRS
jgi:hypothetical protein